MIRLVLFLVGVLALATGLAWLADRPGNLLITWQGYEIETSVFRAVVLFTSLVGIAILAWSLVRQIWSSPAAVSHFLTKRRHRRGLDALSSGMIAIGAGDRSMAARYALQARKSLPNEPLTHLLRAQTAQLSGDKATARRIFEAMLASPDTEQLGLRGLFLEAGREGEREAQRQFAERAVGLNPKLSWPVEALFDLECRAGEWDNALKALATARRYGHIERGEGDRRRALLLTAQAQELEETDAERALTLALEAHGLAPDLIPAAAIAGRLLIAKGNTARAAKVIQRTWAKSPHPELATAYAYARVGDSPRDRLDRVKQLAAINPHSIESSIAVAAAAIEAQDYEEARYALAPHTDAGSLTRRVATLMARIENEAAGDKGRVREWLARAASAKRDPAWTADGVVADRWAPISPVTGALDAYQWRVPIEEADGSTGDTAQSEIEALIALAEAEAPVTVEAIAGSRKPAADADAASENAGADRYPDRAPSQLDADMSEAREPVEEAEPARPAGVVSRPERSHQQAAPAARNLGTPGGKRRSAEDIADETARDASRNAAPEAPMDAPRDLGEPTVVPHVRRRQPPEPKIFVSPHAPDDPGPAEGEGDPAALPLRPSRA